MEPEDRSQDLQAELNKLRAERDRLAEESRRHGAAAGIAAALMGRGIHGPAALEVATMLARSADLLPDGTPRVGDAVGADSIAAAHLKGRGSFLLDTARAQLAKRPGATISSEVWNIQKATQDMEYDLEWKRTDPAGNKAAWAKFLAEKEREMVCGDGRKWSAAH
ncbi:MAG: hypothetical protein KA354_22915 [Phycisphaerae bacterium]|nr:hypothetical protein [Phycisphaerae bacterium]